MSLPNINVVRQLDEQRRLAEAELKRKQEEAVRKAEADRKARLPAEIEAYKQGIITALKTQSLPLGVREPPEGGQQEITQWLEQAGYKFHAYYRHGWSHQVVDPKRPETWGQSK